MKEKTNKNFKFQFHQGIFFVSVCAGKRGGEGERGWDKRVKRRDKRTTRVQIEK